MDQKEQTTLVRVTGKQYCYSKLILNKRNGSNILNTIKNKYANKRGKDYLARLFVSYIKQSVNSDVYYEIVKNGYTDEFNHELYSIVWDIIDPNTDKELKVLLEGLNVINSQIQISDINNSINNQWDMLEDIIFNLLPEEYSLFLIELNKVKELILPKLDPKTKDHIIDMVRGKHIHDLSLYCQYVYYIALSEGIDTISTDKFSTKLIKELNVKDKLSQSAYSLIKDTLLMLSDKEIGDIKKEIALCYTNVISRRTKKTVFTQTPNTNTVKSDNPISDEQTEENKDQ